MGHKKRGYQRDVPENLVKDYRLFAIACEGGKREPEYFRTFELMAPNKIVVDIITDKISETEKDKLHEHKSAPKYVLDRAIKYIEKEGLSEEDQLWFVIDVDNWEKKQLIQIYNYCKERPNWHIVLSNPCFEVWLYFHKKANIALSDSSSCAEFKNEISTFEKGGYHHHKFIPHINDAIAAAKKADSETAYFFPKPKETKVYELCEALLKVIGKNAFDDFIENKLPLLMQRKMIK